MCAEPSIAPVRLFRGRVFTLIVTAVLWVLLWAALFLFASKCLKALYADTDIGLVTVFAITGLIAGFSALYARRWVIAKERATLVHLSPSDGRLLIAAAFILAGICVFILWVSGFVPDIRWQYAMIPAWVIGAVFTAPLAIWIPQAIDNDTTGHIVRALIVAIGVTPTFIGPEGALIPCWLIIPMCVAALFSGDDPGSVAFVLLFFLIPAAPVFIITWLLSVGVAALRGVTRRGCCPQCDYDLRGNPEADVCPECGTPVHQIT